VKNFTFFFIIVCTSFILSAGVSYADLDYGLLAYYPLNGNANDESGNENHGVELGNLKYVDGISGQAAIFDGINDCISILDSSSIQLGSDSFSFTMWLKADKFSGNNSRTSVRVLEKNNYPKTWWVIDILQDGSVEMEMGDSNSVIVTSISKKKISTNQWFFITIVIDRLNFKIQHYINGIFEGEGTISSKFVGDLDVVSKNLFLGSNWNKFSGCIDELRLYNRVISNYEIQKLYNNDCNYLDSDSDGVIDQWDECPDTPLNSYVNSKGCIANNNSAVSGQVLIKGQPLTQGNATLIQSGELFQKSQLDANGYYKFDKVVEEKSMNIMIK